MLETHELLYQRASLWLANQPRWGTIIESIGPCLHQTKPEREPYEALVRAIAYQQLTARAGDAILKRLRLAFHTNESSFPSPKQLADSSLDKLRQCGFSARKAATLKAIGEGVLTGLIPSSVDAACLSDDEFIVRLTSLKGVGRWTVEMLLIYTFERMDIMPLDDFGIIEGLHYLHSPTRTLPKRELMKLSEKCSPYRTVASWYLWRIPQLPDYHVFKAERPATK